MDLLIVDDEASLRDFLTIVFEEDGCRVETADSLAEARAAVQKHEPDLILCDLMLPDGSGLELLREVKAQNPSVAIIMITAHTSAKSAVEALKAGAFDYIAKPISLKQLIQEIVHQSSPEIEARKGEIRVADDLPEVPALDQLTHLQVSRLNPHLKHSGEHLLGMLLRHGNQPFRISFVG